MSVNLEVENFENESMFSSKSCTLCNRVSNPDTDFGCDKSNEKGCNWHIPEQQPDESIKTILDKVLANEKIRDNAVTNAKYIQGKLPNWFTIDQLIKKSNFDDKRVAQDILDLLCLFSLAYRDVKEGNLTKYKITLSKEDRKKLILEEMKETEEKLKYLDRMLQDLENL